MGKLLFLATLLCVTVSLSHCKKKDCYDGSDPFLHYKGTLNVTKSGKTCQRWDTNKPHNITGRVNPSSFPEKSLTKAKNYCRNPYQRRPWCYTTDKKVPKEMCDLPLCKGLDSCYFRHIRTYKGTESKSASGKKCLRWDSRAVKKKRSCRACKDVNNFPDATIKDANNYCRQAVDINGFFTPWCFTSESKGTKKKPDWEYCKIDHCPDKCHAILEDNYVTLGARIDTVKTVKVTTQQKCIDLCKKTKNCYIWSWVSNKFSNKKYHTYCFLKRKAGGLKAYKGISSGTKWIC